MVLAFPALGGPVPTLPGERIALLRLLVPAGAALSTDGLDMDSFSVDPKAPHPLRSS